MKNKIKEQFTSWINTVKENPLVKEAENHKMAGLLASIVLLPIIMVLVFFYGGINAKNLSSSINQQEAAVEEQGEEPSFELKLISREDFLEKFSAEPAFLPRPVEVTTSLSGFLRSNSSGALLPARNWGIPFEDIPAQVAVAVEMPSKRVLYGKNISEVRSIASISKLVTGLVVAENLNVNTEVEISESAVRAEGNAGNFLVGEVFTVKELLYALLLESSNDAGIALEEFYNSQREAGSPDLVSMMNKKAMDLSLNDTTFEDPTGLSPNNRSSALSITKILYEAYNNDVLREIMATPSYTAKSTNREISHYWINLNSLIGVEEGVLGGKTGYIEEAGPSMTVISSTPQEGKYIVTVVLNADDRLEASRQLLNWTKKAYIWTE